jgi:cytochrome c oxidase subunit 2
VVHAAAWGGDAVTVRTARRTARSPFSPVAVVALIAMMGCRGALDQSVLEPSGPQAARITTQWWFAFSTSAAVYVLTIGFLLWALSRARRRADRGEALPADHEHRMTLAVGIASGVTLAILLLFFVYDLSVGRTLSPVPSRHPLTITVVGHQWWWEVQYEDTVPQNRITTANEIHIPVGEPILFRLEASDVIHSIWVPNLAGKKDLIPGYTQTLWFQADTAGIYRGQCAEFCGMQHAKMALFVVAEPRPQYEAWAKEQLKPAEQPTDTVAQHGGEVFMTASCAMCHAVNGTSAGASNGPDLTHLASRHTIAAGTLPNTRGNLAGWILDPQTIKPGANMPPNMLSPKDLDALLAYLQGLK